MSTLCLRPSLGLSSAFMSSSGSFGVTVWPTTLSAGIFFEAVPVHPRYVFHDADVEGHAAVVFDLPELQRIHGRIARFQLIRQVGNRRDESLSYLIQLGRRPEIPRPFTGLGVRCFPVGILFIPFIFQCYDDRRAGYHVPALLVLFQLQRRRPGHHPAGPWARGQNVMNTFIAGSDSA